jgi:antitoxin ParD1/3/4
MRMICANFVILLRLALEGSRPMNISIGPKWEKFLESEVSDGRYGSASEVVREGLRLVEEREAKLAALRHKIGASIAAGGDLSDEDIEKSMDRYAEELANQGY